MHGSVHLPAVLGNTQVFFSSHRSAEEMPD